MTKILQIHLYWQENGISFKTIYETYEKMVHANDQLADITVEEIFSYLNGDDSPQLNFNNSDYEKLDWLFVPFYPGEIDYSPLKHCINLKQIILGSWGISDISFISGMKKLKTLEIEISGTVDARSLVNLESLENLYFTSGRVKNINALAGLPNLKNLDLYDPDEKELLEFMRHNTSTRVKYHDTAANINLTVTTLNDWAFSVYMIGDEDEITMEIKPLCVEAFKQHQNNTKLDFWQLLRNRAKEIARDWGGWTQKQPDVSVFETDNATFLRCQFPGIEF